MWKQHRTEVERQKRAKHMPRARCMRTITPCVALVMACGGGGDGIPADGPPLNDSCSASPDNCTGENICIGVGVPSRVRNL